MLKIRPMGLSIEDLYRVHGTILLMGETGCGKTHLAHDVHRNSSWKEHPFLGVNLATMVDSLLESELFGHVRGSFTGSTGDRFGLAERVGCGTLFLDEISELGLNGQKKLLSLLEEKKFIPVGGNQQRIFKGRIIAATNRNLWELVKRGEFREDLYFRLRVFTFSLEPLRFDPSRVEYFLFHFLEQYKKKFSKRNLTFERKALKILLDCPWYGNIREVKNCMEYAVTLARGPLLEEADLPEWVLQLPLRESPVRSSMAQDLPLEVKMASHLRPAVTLQSSWVKNQHPGILPEKLPMVFSEAQAAFEASFLSHVLEKFQGKVNYTARELGLSKSTLIAKTRKYGINTLLLRARSTC